MLKSKLIILCSIATIIAAQDLRENCKEAISTFIDLIKTKNTKKLKTFINYPLRRNYPLPDIKNEDDFLDYYDTLFDDSLTKLIITSDIEKDWSRVGYKGIMFKRGTLWLDFKGQIKAVNYQSDFEQKDRHRLIELDKQKIHESLRIFIQPKLLLRTEAFIIRIDEIEKGVFRYTSWPINSRMDQKPELVILKGNWRIEGNGGNNRYEFIINDMKYECSINFVGTDETPPADLTIYKNDTEILYQAARIIRN